MAPLTKSQVKEYKRATKCHICFKPFTEKKRKVRDHCHYSGLYQGAAHSSCNLQYKIPNYIPVVFHNLAGYDAHLFIRELAKHVTGMGVIAKNKEDYISFSIKVEVDKYIDKDENERIKEMELRFIDSIKFMSSSLDSLVNNLAKRGHQFFGLSPITTINANCSFEKEFTHMSTWIVGIDSTKRGYLVSSVSIVISTCQELVIQTTSMPAPFGENLQLGIWENTTTYT